MATTSDYTTIVGRHARYKAGQQIIVTWLANTAAKYKDLATYFQYLTKTKPKTRQAAVRVATHELIPLADIIIKGEPRTTVPEDIFKVLQDVIAGRRAANMWYSSQPKHSDHDGHLFFIDALVRVRDFLQPGRSKIPVEEKMAAKKKKSTGPVNAIEQEVGSLSNVFACLDVHEPAAEPLGSAAKTNPTAAKVARKFTLEDDHEQDMFALWCFLEDMNDIRQTVRELWGDVRRGEVTTLVAGLTTELAVGMIHRSYDDFVATYPQFSYWTSIASFLGLQVYINNNVVYLLPAKPTNATTPANSQSNAADLLCTSATFLLRAYVEATGNCLDSSKELRNGFADTKLGAIMRPRPISKLEPLLCSIVPELVSLAQYSRKEEISQEAWEMVMGPGFRPKQDTKHPWARHHGSEFTNGLFDIIWRGGHIDDFEPPMWLSICCATLMDIQDQVGSSPKLGGDIAVAYEKHVLGVIKNATQFRIDPEYEGLLPLVRSTELAERGLAAAVFLETVAQSRELDTLRAQSAAFTDRLMQCHKIKAKILTLDTFPHSAGEMLYVRKVHLHDPAVDAANELQAILILAHFYKAASCYGLVDVAWHDMDFVVAQHSIQKPFVTKTGKGTNAYAMLRHFLIDLGVEASAFAGGKLPPPPSQANVIKKSKKLSPYDSAFRAALLARHYTLQEQGGSRGRVFDFILTAMSQAAEATTGTKTRKQMRHFTPRDLLVTYKKEMIGDEPRLNFDYTTFTSFCLELLIKLVAVGLLGVSNKELGSLDKPHELVYFMMKDAAEAKTSGRSVSTTTFGRAAAVMQSMLSEHDNNRRFSQAALRKSSGRVPKKDRPEFTPEDPKVEANRQALAGILPDAAIGSSRQVLEIYDPNGSLGTFDQLLSTGTMSALMPGGRHARTVAMIPEGTEKRFKKKVLAEGLELRDRSAAYEVLQRYRS